jgi:hypothetical protein
MYKLFFTDKQRKTTNVLTFTSEDMKLAELQLNVLRDAYNLPEFTELQDGSFTAQNAQFKIILQETTVEHTNTIQNGNTHF